MSAPPATEAPLLLNLMNAVSTAHALAAAIELGLIDQLTSGQKKINELAHVCATDPSMTALLLDALAGLGLVRRDTLGGCPCHRLAAAPENAYPQLVPAFRGRTQR